MRIARREVGAPGEFGALADDELERALIERFAQLGLAPESDTRTSADTDIMERSSD